MEKRILVGSLDCQMAEGILYMDGIKNKSEVSGLIL